MKKIILLGLIIIGSVVFFFFVMSRSSILSRTYFSTITSSPSSTALSIKNTFLPVGTVGIYYGFARGGAGETYLDWTLVPEGGNGSYEWSISSGNLPLGLRFDNSPYISSCGDPCSGYRKIDGIPTVAGSYPITFTVRSGAQNVSREFVIEVNSK